MKKRIARLTSNILNPFTVSLASIILLSFEATSTLTDAVKWVLILIGVSILPVFLVVIYFLRSDRLGSFFINIRSERHKIYLLSAICMVFGFALLYYLKAPAVLLASVVASLLSSIVFMSINFLWKISVHTAFVGASIAIMAILYGKAGILTVALLPVTAWARTELEHHSLAQAAAGALLAPVIVLGVFYSFGLVPFQVS